MAVACYHELAAQVLDHCEAGPFLGRIEVVHRGRADHQVCLPMIDEYDTGHPPDQTPSLEAGQQRHGSGFSGAKARKAPEDPSDISGQAIQWQSPMA
jgi:hypothetical protein